MKLRLNLADIRMDLHGDGQKLSTLARMSRGTKPRDEETRTQFWVAFDQTDVHWLRAQCQCHLALSEFLLAHDWQQLFHVIGPRIFADADSPFATMPEEPARESFGFLDMDALAVIHLIDWPVHQPRRMRRVLKHLESFVEQFRQMMVALGMEVDDDDEWIASPDQTNRLANVKITRGTLANWRKLLDHVDALLQGRQLAPLLRDFAWQGVKRTQRGVNVRRVFLEPRTFDFVLWVQGSAALPYLEEGELDHEFWLNLFQMMTSGRWDEYGLLIMP